MSSCNIHQQKHSPQETLINPLAVATLGICKELHNAHSSAAYSSFFRALWPVEPEGGGVIAPPSPSPPPLYPRVLQTLCVFQGLHSMQVPGLEVREGELWVGRPSFQNTEPLYDNRPPFLNTCVKDGK